MADHLLTGSQKKELLQNMKEVDMHKELVLLFEKMYDDKTIVHNTHGQGEFGRDIIISQKGPMKNTNTAVVVKMDKLSGSSLDKGTNDVRNQVEQCFNLDIKPKDGFHDLPIDDVFIVIFGVVSQNATSTLSTMLKSFESRYKIFSINDMLPLFDEHYPEVFYGASGLNALNSKYDELEKALKEKRYYNPNCFIEPNLRSFNKSKQEMVATSNSSNDKKVRAETIKNNIFGKKESIQSLTHKLNSTKHDILIEGDAGSGKSIFSSKLMEHLIRIAIEKLDIKKKNMKISVPVMFKATELKNKECNKLQEKMNAYYTESAIDYHINILIIDGLDEVDEESKRTIIDKASILCKQENISLVLTSRKSTLTRSLVQSFEKFELVPFETSQAINFLKKMSSGNATLTASLLKGLDQLKNQIPMYPMALALLIEIVQEKQEVPASITELYSQYIDIALGKYSYTDGINTLFEPSIKLSFLQELSYKAFYLKKVTFISRDEFDIFLSDYVSAHSSIGDKDEFLFELARVSLIKLKEDEVEFGHKSFLDYFISSYYEQNAIELFEEKTFDDIYKCYHTTLWEDVTGFYFGIKQQINKKDIDKIIECDPGQTPFLSALHRFGIGRLIQYAWNSKADTKEYAIEIGVQNIFELRNLFYEYNTEQFEMELPKIISDVNLMHLISESYTSTFLNQEIRQVINKSLASIKAGTNTDKEDEMFYFGALYVVTNSQFIENTYIENFIKDFIAIEDKLTPTTSLPISALLASVSKSIEREKGDLELVSSLVQVQNKLRKKYKSFSQSIFSFKKQIDKMKLQELVGKK